MALIERDTFGGTCLNRGCIPSKMFVYAADVAHQAGRTGHLGVDTSLVGVRWGEMVGRVFGRIDPIARGGEDYRHSLDNVTVFKGDARFVGHKVLEVGGRRITGDHIVLAAGARPFIPPIPGLEQVPYHTSDTVMRLEALPERLVILGGGYIAAELGHVFDAMGVSVSIVNRSKRLLRAADEDVSATFTEIVAGRMDCALGSPIVEVTRAKAGIKVRTEARDVIGDLLLVATGRVPNGEQLGVTRSGVELDRAGYVVTDEFCRTGVEGVWALGDICHSAQLKHTANEDTRAVAHNIAHPDDLRRPDHSGIPHAVFAHPQVAAVGATEQALRAGNQPYVESGSPLRRYRLRVGHGGHHQLCQGSGRSCHPPAAGSPHHRPPGSHPHPAANPGPPVRPHHRSDGPGPALHPPRSHRSGRTSPPRPALSVNNQSASHQLSLLVPTHLVRGADQLKRNLTSVSCGARRPGSMTAIRPRRGPRHRG